MDRVFRSHTSAAPPSPPVSPLLGYPTSGNPAEGVPATQPGPWWFHMITEELRNVIVAAEIAPDATSVSQLVLAIAKIANSGNRFPCLPTGEPLPDSDIGPIWHDDYNSIITWQVFDANGANYKGYASIFVGDPIFSAQPTPRKGYIPSGVSNLGRTAYAALRGWAIHNGIMVAESVWQAGTIAVKDNADGLTFTLYDLRGEFIRAWDAGRGADVGRAFGTHQGDAIRNITGTFSGLLAASGAFVAGSHTANASTAAGHSVGTITFNASRVVPTADENRTRNTALPLYVKF